METIYRAKDGQEFTTKTACAEYETIKNQLAVFVDTYFFRLITSTDLFDFLVSHRKELIPLLQAYNKLKL